MVRMDVATDSIQKEPVNHASLNSLRNAGRIGKRELAKRYLVGVRTIENWHARGLIHGGPQRGKVLFEVADCDERLLAYRR